jgi:hypothetical protein
MLFWKHKQHGHVIADTCHNKLPPREQYMYHSTQEPVTHTVEDTDDGDSFVLLALATEMASGGMDSSPAPDTSTEVFGGGDGGGAGATDNF